MELENGKSGTVGSHPESKTRAPSSEEIVRRTFFIASAAANGTTGVSYAQIVGANVRISLCHAGMGNRSPELASVVAGLKDSRNVEVIAVCDLWKTNRERAVKADSEAYGRLPAHFSTSRKCWR